MIIIVRDVKDRRVKVNVNILGWIILNEFKSYVFVRVLVRIYILVKIKK